MCCLAVGIRLRKKYMWLDQMVLDMSGYLEDPKRSLRKVQIGVECSIRPVLLKAHDPYSNRGKLSGILRS